MKTLATTHKTRAPNASRAGSTVLPASWSCQTQTPQVRQLLHGPTLQTKLTIGAPNDAYEREADRIADRVMRMPDTEVQATPAPPTVQRLCPECEEELRAKPESGGTNPAAPVPPIVHDVLRSPGRPLDAASRAFFEPRFERSFDDVRVHTDAKAAAAARAVSALGYTVGKDMVFGAGQYAPHTHSGRSLIAHELTHVLQQSPPKHSTAASSFLAVPAPAQSLQRTRCKGDEDPNSIISAHTVTPATIEKPGDSVQIDARFNCEVRSWNSIIEKTDGTSLDLKIPKTEITDSFTRTWDGKKFFKDIGTFLVDDGEYRHRLQDLIFGYRYNRTTKKSDPVSASGPDLLSPTITVGARAFHGPGVPHHHSTLANEASLADIMKSEMGIGNDTEKEALAWAVRNQMIRLSTSSVDVAQDHYRDEHGQTAGFDEKVIAELILEKPMSDDITGGSIKWFSPRSMPKKGESCAGVDCRGGLITVQDDAGTAREVYAPSWHSTMSYVTVTGTREWYVRFYALS